MNFKKIRFICVILIGCGNPAVASPFKDLPGSIDLNSERQAASDLTYNGKLLLPDEARQLVRNGIIKDLSQIDPISTSVLWQDQDQSQTRDSEELSLSSEEEVVNYITDMKLPVGRMGFLAEKRLADGRVRIYQMILGNKSENALMRKTLLRKLGYRIPPSMLLKNVRLKFKGNFSRDNFVRDMKKLTHLEHKKWVISDETDSQLHLRDILVFQEAKASYYNLASGDMTSEVIQGRRLLSSLIVPYWIVDAPENLNLMSWTGYEIFNDQLYLPYSDAAEFYTSYDEARWIARRILKLNRHEWKEIAESTRFPPEAVALLTEKLISRRNGLLIALRFNGEFSELEFYSNINHGSALQNGKLLECPETMARRLCSTDPEAPLSFAHIKSLLNSKAFTNAVNNAVAEFNLRYLLKENGSQALHDRALKQFVDQWLEYITTGKVSRLPRKFFSTPVYDTNILLSREVIAGSYLGVENQIQVADMFGFTADIGNGFFGEGFPTDAGAVGFARLSFLKTYTHVKPMKMISEWYKEPFRNMMVPKYKGDIAESVEDLISRPLALENFRKSKTESETQIKEKMSDLRKEKSQLPREEKQRRPEIDKELELLSQQLDQLSKQEEDLLNQYIESAKNFDQLFGVGESLIIETSYGPDLQLMLNKSTGPWSQVYLKLRERLSIISRIHVHRQSYEKIQIYYDPATANQFSIAFGFQARIPIMEISFHRPQGKVATHFFDLPVSLPRPAEKGAEYRESEADTSAELTENHLNLLAAVLRGTSLTSLKKEKQPWTIQHRFQEKEVDFKLLHLMDQTKSNWDDIRVTHPNGENANYLRRTKGRRTGKNYESVVLDITNHWLAEQLGYNNITIRSSNDGNPADSLFGKSATKQLVTELKSTDLDSVYARYDYRWRGWFMNKVNLLSQIDEINKRFSSQLFYDLDFNNTSQLQFYRIEVALHIYQKAVHYLLSQSDDEVKKVFEKHSQTPSAGLVEDDYRQSWSSLALWQFTKLKKSFNEGKEKEFIKYLTDFLEITENQLSFVGFLQLVGGEKNIFLSGSINGYRRGEQSELQSIQARQVGEISSQAHMGPLNQLTNEIGISGGEFFASWILKPL